jgi:hypothetical protein
MQNGWVKLHRKLLDSLIFSSEKGLKIWIWCLMRAGHKNNKFLLGRQRINLKSGQFIMGGKKTEEELEIARTTIYYWIDFLMREGMIDIKKTNKYTIITIKNWDKYQQVDIKSTSNDTTDGHQMDTNKKDKNNKESIALSYEEPPKDTYKTKAKIFKQLGIPYNPPKRTTSQKLVWDTELLARYIKDKSMEILRTEVYIRQSDAGKGWQSLKRAIKEFGLEKCKEQCDKYLVSEKCEKFGADVSIMFSEHSLNMGTKKIKNQGGWNN